MQVIVAAGAIEADTAVVFVGTKDVIIDVQPLDVFVTTHVYVPPEFIFIVAEDALVIIPGPDQL